MGWGRECTAEAPSLIPKTPGDRINTNRPDAVSFPRLLRAGKLTPVWVPDAVHGSRGGARSGSGPRRQTKPSSPSYSNSHCGFLPLLRPAGSPFSYSRYSHSSAPSARSRKHRSTSRYEERAAAWKIIANGAICIILPHSRLLSMNGISGEAGATSTVPIIVLAMSPMALVHSSLSRALHRRRAH